MKPKPKKVRKAADRLENKFAAMWRANGGTALEREFLFHVERRWRFDFAHVATRTAVEINGGVFTGGAHVRSGGVQRDYAKLNEAQLLGWTVFQLSGPMITRAWMRKIREWIGES